MPADNNQLLLLRYVMSNSGKNIKQTIKWLNEFCPNWRNTKAA